MNLRKQKPNHHLDSHDHRISRLSWRWRNGRRQQKTINIAEAVRCSPWPAPGVKPTAPPTMTTPSPLQAAVRCRRIKVCSTDADSVNIGDMVAVGRDSRPR